MLYPGGRFRDQYPRGPGHSPAVRLTQRLTVPLGITAAVSLLPALEDVDRQFDIRLRPIRFELLAHPLGRFRLLLLLQTLHQTEQHPAVARRAPESFAKDYLRVRSLSRTQQRATQ